MKITDTLKTNALHFDDLEPGDAFQWILDDGRVEDGVFVKTFPGYGLNAIDITTGKLNWMCSVNKVQKLDIEVIIY